ncbi:MAG: hypothetical protein LBB74_03210 [Chitinispirillales bacterium]|jgi:hypothetical protein|nr:hypothetical protein [Chitinispirillales bacterium]
MSNKDKIRTLLFSSAPIREFLFFIFRKKVYRKSVDKKLSALLNGNHKLSEKKIDGLVVSLTSFPQRIAEVKYAVYSLLTQTVRPEKIILWLAESQFPDKEPDLPDELPALKKYGFDICWCEDLRSYKKLIPALERFPNHFIATADDDIYYNKKWLARLWESHLKNPDCVICHAAKTVEFGADGAVIPFTEWKRNTKDGRRPRLNVQLGAGGVLYHKKYLHEDVCRKELFTRLAPYADDLWFYFMALLRGTPVRVAENSCAGVKYVNPYREYGFEDGYTLLTDNVNNGGNDRQFKNLIEHYKSGLPAQFGKEPYSRQR